MMAGLPAGWESGYDGRRWFYTYRATGHVQYGFPCEGDEFPDFVDEGAPAPALAPEERLESQQQLRRQTAARGPVAHDRPRMSATAPRPVSDVWEGDLAADDDDDDGGGGGGRGEHVFQPESFMFLGPGAYADVSPLVEDEDEAAKRAVAGDARDRTEEPWASSLVVADVLPHELPVDDVVSPPGGFDPVGHVAEMPTEQTPASRADLHPEPVEMADPSVLAPVETVTAAELLQSPASPGQQEAVKPPVPSRPQKLPLPRETQQQAGSFQQEAKPPPPAEARRRSLHAEGLQAAYQPYVPGPLRSVSPSVVSDGSRRSSSAELQRELSLMMASRPAEPAALDPTAVPRVLSPPQVPPRKPVDGTGALRQDLRRSSLGKGPSTNSSPGTDHQQVLHVDEQQRDSLQELRQPAAPPTSTPPTDDQENGGPGGQQAQKTVLSKFPSVLKPARGRGAMLQSRRVSLAQQDEAPAPAWNRSVNQLPRVECLPGPPSLPTRELVLPCHIKRAGKTTCRSRHLFRARGYIASFPSRWVLCRTLTAAGFQWSLRPAARLLYHDLPSLHQLKTARAPAGRRAWQHSPPRRSNAVARRILSA
ncbi:hypothetical protein CDD83_527 [Cordyceps sp. RAO-2017]|nr:hypothetical protein CDD83_527 [Cordyceps sp. RAO-2017]